MYTRYNRAASRRHYHVNCISKKYVVNYFNCLMRHFYLSACYVYLNVCIRMCVRVTHNQCCIIRMPTHVLTIPNTQTKLYSPLVQFTYTLIYLHAHAHTHIR